METDTQLERDTFLKHLLETAEEARRVVFMFDIGETLGFSRQKTKRIVQYLEGEGLVEWQGRDGVCLTHLGLKAAVALSDKQEEEDMAALSQIRTANAKQQRFSRSWS